MLLLGCLITVNDHPYGMSNRVDSGVDSGSGGNFEILIDKLFLIDFHVAPH